MTPQPQRPDPLDRGELQRRAVRGAAWTGIHTLVSLPLAFLVNILIARVLGVEDYGRLAYLTTVITIATVVAGMGVTTALIQFGSREHAAGRPASVNRLLSGAQGFRLLVMGPLIALAVLAFVRVELWLLVVALIFGVGLPALLGTAQDALTIENRTDRAAQLAMIANAVTQVAVVAAVLTIGTADGVWSARVIVAGAVLALPLFAISRAYRRSVLRPKGPWSLPKSFWKFAIPTGAAGIIGALTSNRIELVLLDLLSDPLAMGIFGLAFGLAGHVYAPAQALIGPLIPALSGLAEIDRSAVRRAFLRTSRVASSVGGLLVAGALPALALMVPVLYGTDFFPARDHVVALGLAGAVTLVGSPHSAFLMARLGGRRMLIISVVVLIVNLGLGVVLIPILGVWGATVCCVSAMLVRVFLVTKGEASALGVRPAELGRNLGALIVGVAVSAAIWGVVRSLDTAPIPLAATVIGGAVALHLATVWLLGVGLSREDVGAIASSLPRGARGGATRILGLTAHFRGATRKSKQSGYKE